MQALMPTSISKLTEQNVSVPQRQDALRAYAVEQGWRPSDEIAYYPDTEGVANGHLLVEHGLDNTAVISFLRSDFPFTQLDWAMQHRLLAISYNNLVDWHLFPDRNGVLKVYNRSKPFVHEYLSVNQYPNVWRAEAFDKIVGRRPNPNLPNLDDALIRTVSDWKRIIASECNLFTDTAPIGELFNAIFFVRALEDDARNRTTPHQNRLLLELVRASKRSIPTAASVLHSALEQLTKSSLPPELIDEQLLRRFDSLDRETLDSLFSNFYDNKFAPYSYDFSLMSKHALSRIYEHYISILKEEKPEQRRLFPAPADEFQNRERGGVYTPQYIARFFARFLKESHTPPRFRTLQVADPACGSGMFLRTLLELQCDPMDRIDVTKVAAVAFPNALGIDVEVNACKATRLSLTLLHLVLTGSFPPPLRITEAETIDYVRKHPGLNGSFDAVIANPPYVKWEEIDREWQPRVAALLESCNATRADLYLAFIKIGMDLLKPGGFMLLVLPHAFLLAENSAGLRDEIAKGFSIRFLVDLSDVQVFEEINSYPILLIAEKHSTAGDGLAPAVIVRCAGFAGHALQDALDGHQTTTPFYTIYSTPQDTFHRPSWRLLPPRESAIRDKVQRFDKLSRFLTIAQGMNTGMDKVFIRPCEDVPTGEQAAYVPLLQDREMQKFRVPATTAHVVFYPFGSDDTLLSEDEIQARFPETWKYLESHHAVLSGRKYAIENANYWWRPERPRKPALMLRPKLVTPHLVLFPRFAIDDAGRYAVSRAPILLAASVGDAYMLRYFLAVLNSSVGHWQITTQSHKYQRGYARLERATLQEFCVPAPAGVQPTTMQRIQRLVGELVADPAVFEAETELNEIICDLYGITLDEIQGVEIARDG